MYMEQLGVKGPHGAPACLLGGDHEEMLRSWRKKLEEMEGSREHSARLWRRVMRPGDADGGEQALDESA
jgi:hypothetical protein